MATAQHHSNTTTNFLQNHSHKMDQSTDAVRPSQRRGFPVALITSEANRFLCTRNNLLFLVDCNLEFLPPAPRLPRPSLMGACFPSHAISPWMCPDSCFPHDPRPKPRRPERLAGRLSFLQVHFHGFRCSTSSFMSPCVLLQRITLNIYVIPRAMRNFTDSSVLILFMNSRTPHETCHQQYPHPLS